ncbi:ankyrin repeat domain-containing protein [Acinetobacter sp. BSP-153]|uniref:ankyrin repeat domain-containing protein n=1 Tax=Acinetobacter sp. BSP-153 TaxID=3344663 RepID=UPI00376FC802
MKFLFNGLMVAVLSLSTSVVYAEQTTSTASLAQSQQALIDLFFAAARTGNQDVMSEFLKYGFPVNQKNHAGFTGLMIASYYGHQDVVTLLLTHGADRCLRDHKGNTALMGAIFKLEWSIANQLRQVDCDVQAKQTGQKTVREFAKVIGQEQQLEKWIETESQQK